MSDLDPFLNGPLTPAGRSGYNPGKFRPRKGRQTRANPFEPANNPFDQQHSGDPLNRPSKSEKEVRVRTDGGIPAFLRPEDHRLLVIHPLYETRRNADGTSEYYIVRQGERRCSCGQSHGAYEQPWEGKPDEGPVAGWDEDMLRAAGIDTSPRVRAPAVPETDWWDD
jgi:hypothetical protein